MVWHSLGSGEQKAVLREMAQGIMAPSVLVLPTNAAEAITRKNGLSFIDMLRPLSTVDCSSVSLHTTREQPYRISDIKVCFCEPGDVEQSPPELLDMALEAVVKASEPSEGQETGQKGEAAPWLDDYKQELERGLRSSEHESLHHPLACLLVASVDEPDLVPTMLALSAMENLPPLFREGGIDPNMLKHYVLLQDASVGMDPNRGEEMVRGIREAFGGSACSLLKINSEAPAEGAPPPPDMWTVCKPLSLRVMAPPMDASTRLGSFLSTQDIRAQQQLVSDFTLKALLPHIDKRVRSLNQQVVAVRKGLKNQFKSWGTSLFGKASDSSREGVIEGSEPRYLFHSVEAQIRSLAEAAAMLQDFDLALSSYRLLIPDLKRDKAHREVGLASIGAALCLLGADQKHTQQDEYLDAAFAAFQRVSLPRNCVHVSLLHASILQSRDRHGEAAERLIRATCGDANDLGSAVLYEEAARCFMSVLPLPQMRKAALHLVHAGHRYLKSGVKGHGVRCYQLALSAYQGKGWSHILDHLLAALAKHSLNLSRIPSALAFYVQLLSNQEGKPADRQQIYVRDFLAVVRQHSPTHLERRLALPILVRGSVTLQLAEPTFEHDSGGDFADHGIHGLRWSDLEESLVDPVRWNARLEHSKSTLVNLRKALPDPAARHPRAIVIGEPTTVSLTLRNPLQLPLILSNFTLAYRFTPQEPDQDPDPQSWHESEAEGGKLSVDELDIELPPGATRDVQVTVGGVVEGWVEVMGIRYKLGGAGGVQCFQAAVLPLKRIKSKKKSNQTMTEADTSLRARVVLGMPRLTCTLKGLEDGSVRHGQLVRAVLEVANNGTVAAHSLRLASSHHHAITLRPPSELDSPPLEGGGGGGMRDAGGEDLPFCNMPVGALEPGTSVRLALWLRPPAATSPFEIRMLVHYTPPTMDGGMPYRLVKLSATLNVLPSLKAGVHVRWAEGGGGGGDRLVVAVEMQEEGVRDAGGRGAAAVPELMHVACLSPRWAVSLLSQGVGVGTPVPPPDKQVRQASPSVWLLEFRPHENQTNAGGVPVDQVTVAKVGQGASPLVALEGTALGALVFGVERAEKISPGGKAGGTTRIVLVWREEGSGAVGFNHVACPMPSAAHHQMHVAPSIAAPAPPITRADSFSVQASDMWPVRVHIDAPTSVAAAAAGCVTIVGVTVVLCGVGDDAVDVRVEAEETGAEGGRGWDYEWGGNVQSLVAVPARGEARVPLEAIVRRPSTVNLNRITLSFPNATNLHKVSLSASRFQALLTVRPSP